MLLELDELGLACEAAANLLVTFGREAEQAGRPENALTLYRHALSLWPASEDARRYSYALCKRNEWKFPSELFKAVARDAYMELHELTPIEVRVKNDKLRYHETKWGMPFYNNGTTFAQGLWAPAPSRITFDLDGRYKMFTARVLVSAFDGQPQQRAVLEKELAKTRAGTVRFGIGGDGRTLFESDIISYADGSNEVSVDVTGVKTLVLEVTDADGSDLLDFAVWADAKLYMR
jgi:hypothetical protein